MYTRIHSATSESLTVQTEQPEPVPASPSHPLFLLFCCNLAGGGVPYQFHMSLAFHHSTWHLFIYRLTPDLTFPETSISVEDVSVISGGRDRRGHIQRFCALLDITYWGTELCNSLSRTSSLAKVLDNHHAGRSSSRSVKSFINHCGVSLTAKLHQTWVWWRCGGCNTAAIFSDRVNVQRLKVLLGSNHLWSSRQR